MIEFHDFVIYDETTGEILRTGHAPPGHAAIQIQDGEEIISGVADDRTQYVDLDAYQIVDKPVMSVTVDGMTVTCPAGTKYAVSGPASAWGVAGDGVLEFSFSEPGEYTVALELFPYLPAEVALHAG